MNTGTKIRTILVIATCLNTALLSTDFAQFNNPTVDFIYRIASVALNFIIVACATWYNNDYTEEACIGTGITRQLKAEKKEDYIGDYFFSEDTEDPQAESEELVEDLEGEQEDE
ncbi:MAG: hypothetical protein IJH55_03005 [Romboutsia sp.]|nr:hypothetical protein [Romboutsia sp.]